MRIGSRTFEWGTRTHVMGVVNVSPESFSGDGLSDAEAAAEQAAQMERDGADLIDVGGQSTRPGFEELPVEVEVARVVPALRAIKERVSIPVSIDAYRPEVLEAALGAGADVINDIRGLKGDARVAELAVRFEVPVIVMHNQRGRPESDVVAGALDGLRESIAIAEAAGLDRSRLIGDPGFGFGWSVAQNLEMIRRLAEIRVIGLPLLLGTSRKSTIGAVLERPEAERIWGTAASVALAIAHGVDIVRVHDVAEMVQVSRMADAVMRPGS